jgi:hypothetical protein
VADRALTLRLDEGTYQSLRRQAFVQERNLTDIIREALEQRTGRRGPDDPLTVRPNPTITDEDVLAIYREGAYRTLEEALQAIWRNGCDAGMTAPTSIRSESGGD